MPTRVPNRVPVRVLTMMSGKLFLLFLLGALLITSLQEMSLKGLLQRAISVGSLFLIIFAINTLVFHFFDKRRKSNLDKVWTKTFILGFVLSFICFYTHVSIIEWLENSGLYHFSHNRMHLEALTGARYFTFLFVANFTLYSFIFLVQNSVLTQYEKSQIQMELLQLEASNADAINQLLRQQIQPHFLFNALTVLKSLIKRDSKKAETYLLHLSDFLRISISKNSSGVSTIKDELKICNDYMEMQSIRFGNAVKFEVKIPDNDEIANKKIPFFSLQPLLENAIKHNKLTELNPLHITIELLDNYIKISNNLQEKSESEVSTGNGLKMLKERYHILNEETPIIKKDGSTFTVLLKILNDEYSNN